jgi:hypothetical protein
MKDLNAARFLFLFLSDYIPDATRAAPRRVASSRLVSSRLVSSRLVSSRFVSGRSSADKRNRDSLRKVRDAFRSIGSVDDSSRLRSARKLAARNLSRAS